MVEIIAPQIANTEVTFIIPLPLSTNTFSFLGNLHSLNLSLRNKTSEACDSNNILFVNDPCNNLKFFNSTSRVGTEGPHQKRVLFFVIYHKPSYLLRN